jgi:hypothetical protein
MVYVRFWTETRKRKVLCVLLTNKMCEKRNFKLCKSLGLPLLPLCGFALLILLFQGSVTQNFDNSTMKQLVVKLSNLLFTMALSEMYY